MPGKRRVSVELELEIARAIKSANETVVAFRAVAAQMEQLGDETDEVSRDMDQLAATTQVAKSQVNDLGDEAVTAAGRLAILDARIKATRASAGELALEFASTGDPAVGKDMRGQISLARQLEKLREQMVEAIKKDDGDSLALTLGSALGTQAGMRAGVGFLDGFGDAVSALPSQLRGSLILAAVGAGTIMAPFLAGAIGGAIGAGAGLGGIALGIGAASKDPRVIAAAKAFGRDISEHFFDAGDSMVGPIIVALDMIETRFRGLDLGDTVARAAPHLQTVVDGLLDFVEKFLPGFNAALDNSGPLLNVFAEGLGMIGAELGGFLADVSSNAGAVMAFELLLRGVAQTIDLIGENIAVLAEMFRVSIVIASEFTGALEDIPLIGGPLYSRLNDILEDLIGNSTAVRIATEAGVDALARGSTTWDEYRQEVEGVNRAVSDYIGIAMGVDEANLAVAEGLQRMAEEFKKNGRNWDTSTEKGLANNQVLLDQVRRLNEQREANIAAGMDAAKANAQFDAELRTLMRIAEAAGATKQVLQNLIGDYIINVTARLTVTGLSNIDKVDMRRGFHDGGWVNAPRGAPVDATLHGGEFVVSNDMQAGKAPIPMPIAGLGGGGTSAAREMAQLIGREIAAALPPTIGTQVINAASAPPEEVATMVERELAWAASS